jgi:hypothetical protein
MHTLAVEIVRFVDDHQPGWVECEFVDAEGRRHTIVDKVPILSLEPLEATSKYPQAGFVQCEVLNRWEDDKGRKLARISTARPIDIESTEGLSEFVVLSAQLIASPDEDS